MLDVEEWMLLENMPEFRRRREALLIECLLNLEALPCYFHQMAERVRP